MHIWPYLVAGVVLLVVAVLRRVPIIRRLLSIAIWIACAVMLVGVVEQLTDFNPRIARIASLLGLEQQDVVGRETRIAMSPDGHFWVRATIDGSERRMLVDSGATITTLSRRSAAAAGLEPRDAAFPVLLETANGTIAARTATVAELR